MTVETEARIKEIIPRSGNVKSFRLEVKDGPDYKAGQFLCAQLITEKECKRYLSISSSPTEKGYVEFTKKITASDFSVALTGLRPGDKLKVKYPLGNFTLDPRYKKIAFLSGGIGITPIRSMCRYAVDRQEDLDMVLLYANRRVEDVVFKEDLDSMQRRRLPSLKVVHVICEPGEEWKGRCGLINAAVVKEEVPDYSQRRFYLCGPPRMVEAMKRMLLEELLLAKENIVTENFIGY